MAYRPPIAARSRPRACISRMLTGIVSPIGNQRSADSSAKRRTRPAGVAGIRRGRPGGPGRSGRGSRRSRRRAPRPISRSASRGQLEEALDEAAGRRRRQADLDVTRAGRAEPRAIPVEPPVAPLAVALQQPVDLQVVHRVRGLAALRLVHEVRVVPGGELGGGPPAPLPLRALVLVLDDEPVALELSQVVARRPARFAEPRSELGRGRGSFVAERAEQPRPERVGDGAERLDLGDPGAIPCVHGRILTAKTSLHKYSLQNRLCSPFDLRRERRSGRRTAPATRAPRTAGPRTSSPGARGRRAARSGRCSGRRGRPGRS